jgi:uncharacterized membrane protein YfcA
VVDALVEAGLAKSKAEARRTSSKAGPTSTIVASTVDRRPQLGRRRAPGQRTTVLVLAQRQEEIRPAAVGYSAFAMLREPPDHSQNVPPDALADRLRLHSSFFDETLGREREYRVTHTKLGLVLMYAAGLVSGLLGIGSGALKVPAMDLAMRLPIKVSTATSNFMIGVTAAASAGVYFSRGDIDPFVAGPVAAGVVVGSVGGSRLLSRVRSAWLRWAFVVVLLWIAVEMLWKGIAGKG